MDSQLSLIVANQAQIRKGDLILDPFVGTGSLLVSASQFGGYTFGTDIDFLMLHGRTRPTRISQKVLREFTHELSHNYDIRVQLWNSIMSIKEKFLISQYHYNLSFIHFSHPFFL